MPITPEQDQPATPTSGDAPSPSNAAWELAEIKRELSVIKQGMRRRHGQGSHQQPGRHVPVFCWRCDQPGHISQDCQKVLEFKGRSFGRGHFQNTQPPRPLTTSMCQTQCFSSGPRCSTLAAVNTDAHWDDLAGWDPIEENPKPMDPNL